MPAGLPPWISPDSPQAARFTDNMAATQARSGQVPGAYQSLMVQPGATPSGLAGYGMSGAERRQEGMSPLLNPNYAGMNYHDRQQQYWQDQFGTTEGWNQFGGGQFDNQQDRRDARTQFYQNQWDQRMAGGAPGAPAAATRQAGGQMTPQGGVNAPTAGNRAIPQGYDLMNALQGMGMGGFGGQAPGQAGQQGGKGGGQGLPNTGQGGGPGWAEWSGRQGQMGQQGGGGMGGGKGGGQGLPQQQGPAQRQF